MTIPEAAKALGFAAPAALKPAAEPFTDQLRRQTKERLGVCQACGQLLPDVTTRKSADRIGVSHSTLWRFLQGKAPSSALVDKLVAWLAATPAEDGPRDGDVMLDAKRYDY